MTVMHDTIDICRAEAAACTCTKPPGHVEAGDPIHECNRQTCTGAWTGDMADGTFEVVRYPFRIVGTLTIEDYPTMRDTFFGSLPGEGGTR